VKPLAWGQVPKTERPPRLPETRTAARGPMAGDHLEPLGSEAALRQSYVVAQASEEGVTHLALRRLGPVLDLGQQLRLDPDRLVRDALRIRLGLAHQRRQLLAQLRRRSWSARWVGKGALGPFPTIIF
jgi:hypothetical protein